MKKHVKETKAAAQVVRSELESRAQSFEKGTLKCQMILRSLLAKGLKEANRFCNKRDNL